MKPDDVGKSLHSRVARGQSDRTAAEEDCDIREAYPLMDAVARKEGWDDPEMDSYDALIRKE